MLSLIWFFIKIGFAMAVAYTVVWTVILLLYVGISEGIPNLIYKIEKMKEDTK